MQTNREPKTRKKRNARLDKEYTYIRLIRDEIDGLQISENEKNTLSQGPTEPAVNKERKEAT